MLKQIIANVLRRFDLGLHRTSTQRELARRLSRYDSEFRDVAFLRALPDKDVVGALRLLDKSTSQFRQDLFVLAALDHKRNGYFVEFGATNGIDSSNTYLLETEFGWTGILAEPARVWHQQLRLNRRSHIDFGCVWSASDEVVDFMETDDALYSTASKFAASDAHADVRRHGKSYAVPSISLEGLLAKYDAPRLIDYLSIDTEGSEFEILKAFDFEKHEFSVITCEHNFGPNRERVRRLLERRGYERKLEQVSRVDDWYVRRGAGSGG